MFSAIVDVLRGIKYFFSQGVSIDIPGFACGEWGFLCDFSGVGTLMVARGFALKRVFHAWLAMRLPWDTKSRNAKGLVDVSSKVLSTYNSN